VTSNSATICTVSGRKVSFIAAGTCSVTAHVAQGAKYLAADGAAQTFSIVRGKPTAPKITNLPTSAAVGGGFTATVSTNGDGVKSVTSNSTTICTVSGLNVSFIHAGSCSLTAHVAQGTNYVASTGTRQTFAVS
jgi:hypothetical protein